MRDELLDRFGAIPDSVEHLLAIALLRTAAHGLDLVEVKGRNERIVFTFRADARIDVAEIPAFLQRMGKDLSFTAYGTPYFTYRYRKTGLVEKDEELLLTKTGELLTKMACLMSEPC